MGLGDKITSTLVIQFATLNSLSFLLHPLIDHINGSLGFGFWLDPTNRGN